MQFKNTLHDRLRSEMETIDKDEALYDEKNFYLRSQAIDHIEFHIIDQTDAIIENADAIDQLVSLKSYAGTVKRRLEDTDARMFRELRAKIAQGEYRGKHMIALLDEYMDHNLSTLLHEQEIRYSELDVFLNGLLTDQEMPAETIAREPEMVYYQKTPARIILELVEKVDFQPHYVFFDLGSGLGQAAILVNLLASVSSKGVELEPAFCSYANACAVGLNLEGVDFINADARYADYSSGTVFFMYTPFEGKMLQDVLQNLQNEAQKRSITIFTFGPCTPAVAKQSWLINKCDSHNGPDGLGAFVSV